MTFVILDYLENSNSLRILTVYISLIGLGLIVSKKEYEVAYKKIGEDNSRWLELQSGLHRCKSEKDYHELIWLAWDIPFQIEYS